MNSMMVARQGGGRISPGHSSGPPSMSMERPPLTPGPMNQVVPIAAASASSGQMSQSQPQPPGGSISLALLVDFIVQRIYHELTILAELLPRKTDMERKQEIFNFSARNRLLASRLLGLVKWASSAAKVDKSVSIMAFLEKQSMHFVDTADCLARIARETLVHARLPNFHIPAAVEVLTTGTYSRLPLCVRERIVPPDPITLPEKKITLARLNQVIQHRLVTTELPAQMRTMKIEQGRVVFKVDNEFQVSLTVLGDSPTIPWRIIEIEILVEDKEIGDGMNLVHPLQIGYIHHLCQTRLDSAQYPLKDLYDILHSFSQSLQLEVLYSQVLKLCRERLGDYLVIEEYTVGKSIILSYWKDLAVNDPKAELLGYRIIISVDSSDSAQPLGVSHQPPLPIEETAQTGEGLKTNQLEKIMVQTIYLRSRNRLMDLKKEIEMILNLECTLQGSPPVLSIFILTPCLRSEQLLVSVNIHTGSFLVHVPQFDPSPSLVTKIQELINLPSLDTAKLKGPITQLRYWITERRCEKTLQHLPATVSNKSNLLQWEEDKILKNIGPNHLTIKFQKHPYAILIVEFQEKEISTEIEYYFYLVGVKKVDADENEDSQSQSSPKVYLRPFVVIPFDTFASTHGPFTDIEVSDVTEKILGKRRFGGPRSGSSAGEKRQKHPAYFIPELAHLVALCDERLPQALLTVEMTARGIVNANCEVEASATGSSIPIFRFPMNVGNLSHSTLDRLHWHLMRANMRSQTQLKGHRIWNLALKFNPWNGKTKVACAEKTVQFVYEMAPAADEHIPRVVDSLIEDWTAIAMLFDLIIKSNWCKKLEATGQIAIKSYTWKKLIISYGPNRSALVSFVYSLNDKCFRVAFGGSVSHNPHCLILSQLEYNLNWNYRLKVLVPTSSSPGNTIGGPSNRIGTGSLEAFMKMLNISYEPLYALSKLPNLPNLGAVHSRPQFPVQTFVLVPQSPLHIKLVYLNIYCLDIHFQPEGFVSIRDGAYSLFDKTHVLGELTPTQGLKAFLSKYVDENAVLRRRSQSEDDNPPSPISTMMDIDGVNISTPPSGTGFLSGGNKPPQSPAPGRSNPHTPASPHIQSAPTGFSPAASFALASPPSHLSQQSPNPSSLIHPSPSPSLLAAPSPGGPLSVPTPSPNPNINMNPSSQGQVQPASSTSGIGSIASHPSPFFHAENSPAAVQIGSPWATGQIGSPGMPRPSPVRVGHSPQSGMEARSAVAANRVLPQRSWAGAIPTILTYEALDVLCTPIAHLEAQTTPTMNNFNKVAHPCSPIERFLGCSYLRRQLQRTVQTEEHLTLMASEPGVILFRSETMQFRVSLDMNNFQSLHLKVTPSMDHWSQDDLQILEIFFTQVVVSPPFRPNGLGAFAKMVSLPARIIRDFIQIIRLQLYPTLIEQRNWKWGIQLCLTVPSSAIPIIVPPGSSAILTSVSKILFYIHLFKLPKNNQMETSGGESESETIARLADPDKIPFAVLPIIYEMTTNTTQLADKRPTGQASIEYSAVSQHLKRFQEFNQVNLGNECSIFPSIQDLLANLSFEGHPPTGPQQPTPSPHMQMGPGGMVRPQMGPGGQQYPHSQMGPMM